MATKREVKQILVKVRGRDGASYSVALCKDGSYGIARDGELQAPCWGTDADLEDCITAMMRQAGLAKDGDIKPIGSEEPSTQPNSAPLQLAAQRPGDYTSAMALYSYPTHGQLEPWINREWLLTNGLGGYASSSVVSCNTRRYHGLLIAATLPPVGRITTLNRLGEILIIDGDEKRPLEFSISEFEGRRFHPRGDMYLRRFEFDDVVRWEYDVEGIRIVKELQIPWLKNVVGVRYTIDTGGKKVQFRALPFVSMRDFHGLRRAQEAGLPTESMPHTLVVRDGDVALHLHSDDAKWSAQPQWWFGHRYSIETDRGLGDTEDLFNPGRFTADVQGQATVTIWAALQQPAVHDWNAELERRREAVSAEPARQFSKSKTLHRLAQAANDFVVFRKTPDGKPGTSVIAGYPWFADWGRDTMIALPGLLLTTRRFEQAKQVLSVFASYVSEGMIPNRFDDYTNEPHYNTVDASLWFIHAAFEYLRMSKDSETFEKILQPACRAIIDGYRAGTRFNIKMDEADGLVTQGDVHTQLTWMDAKCGDIAFTPRQGKAVEINALWYNALRMMNEPKLADKVAESFRRAFWLSPFRGLADVVNDPPKGAATGMSYQRDKSIRPNQIFAVSLPHSPLNRDEQRAVVEVVRRELLTPVGLRSLAKTDPKYHGKYSGTQLVRDEAYHNGTIWGWLIGGFLDAYLKVHDRSPDSIDQARRWLSPLIDQMQQGACIGQISEIFEADEPHRPVGRCAQAWSVAEVLRLAVELGM